MSAPASSSAAAATIFETPAPPNNGRKRSLYTPASVSDFRSHKKRRMSTAFPDSSKEDGPTQRGVVFGCDSASASTLSLDRFISMRPEVVIPLTISPRTNKMCKQFGILSGNRLSFSNENWGPSSTPSSDSTHFSHTTAYDLLRKSASTLFKGPKKPNQISVSQNLAQSTKFTLALDSPGLSTFSYSNPISWSLDNNIAVACGRDVYYQDLDSRKVTYFFRAHAGSIGGSAVNQATHIGWGGVGHETQLACSNDLGFLEVWDTTAPSEAVVGVAAHPSRVESTVGAIAWNGDQLTWASNETVQSMDLRTKAAAFIHPLRDVNGVEDSWHGVDVVSMAWSAGGLYLATGDIDGVVHVWDVRAQKMLTERGKHGKMKHQGPVKSLAWCPWKADLLATGTFYPEGKMRTWNLATIHDSPYEPERVFNINSSVHSIIWAPSCKEVLSVHGMAWKPPTPIRREPRFFGASGNLLPTSAPPSSTKPRKSKPLITETPCTNSILVHDYPSGKRLLTLTHAHRHSITAAALGPNGQDVFTASPKEQVIKMWQVWGTGMKPEKRKPFSQNVIR